MAGGLAEYFELDPTVVRLLLVLSVFISGGLTLLIYLVMWIVVPNASDAPPPGNAAAARAAGVGTTSQGGDSARLLGIILIGAGLLLVVNRLALFHWFDWGLARFWWPAILIVAGIALISMRRD